jgi:hypothetical protein
VAGLEPPNGLGASSDCQANKPLARTIVLTFWSSVALGRFRLLAINVPALLCNSKTGSDSSPVSCNEGPMARSINLLAWGPVPIRPLIKTLSPVSTKPRVEIFPKLVTDVGGTTSAHVYPIPKFVKNGG